MLLAVIGLIAVLVIGSIIWKRRSAAFELRERANNTKIVTLLRQAHDAKLKDGTCKQRGDVYDARANALERDAHTRLKIGIKKDFVIRFFAENGIPVTFSGGWAEGTIYTTGCSPLGCGTDNAFLGLRVKVDKKGSVVSEPVVDAGYTDCL
jgi:hypothetical protein